MQITASEGHPWRVKPRPEGDVGGPFTTQKVELERITRLKSSPVVFNQAGTLQGRVVDGEIWPSSHVHNIIAHLGGVASSQAKSGWTWNTLNEDYSSSDAFLVAQGTVAIDRCSPVNSVADVATALGELKRDGFPGIPGTQAWKDKFSPSSLGGEYLNYQFGLAPLIGEVKDFAKAASQSGKILRQLERDNGRLVRRRYEFPSEHEVYELPDVENTSPAPVLSRTVFGKPEMTSITGVVKTRVVVKRDRWFSGAFTYYIPTGGSAFQRVARGFLEFDKLFGGVIDPETLWNLTPWSWATDWALNTGSVISNLTDAAQYGLVLPYGYIMERTSVRYEHTNVGASFNGTYPEPISSVITHVTKKRRPATPFGFGLIWDGFDAYQLSILAALGISRRR